jgi:hypothetical protein
MSIDYNRMAATATRLLTDNGQPMALRRTSGGTFDPVTGTTTGQSTADLATVGVMLDIDTSYALANEVQDGDLLAMVDASQTPLLTDKLVVGAEVYGIVKIMPLNPAGTPVAYKLQVRQ